MSILKLIPTAKNYIWGGNSLKTTYNKKAPFDNIAETWEVSCHPDGESIIEYSGEALACYIKRNPNACGANCDRFLQFPVLIKLIDAAENLSVQVHPNDEYALKHEGQLGKTEMWYIVDCQPQAYIYLGFNRDISLKEFTDSIEKGTLCSLLQKVTVKPGDVFFIEAGTIHAIGAGIIICEVQQSSNVTYRVFDYCRIDADGKPRQLNIEKACDVTSLTPAKNDYDFDNHLASCDYFTVDKIDSKNTRSIFVDEKSFVSLIFLSGNGTISSLDESLVFTAGDSFFIEANSGKIFFSGEYEAIMTFIK